MQFRLPHRRAQTTLKIASSKLHRCALNRAQIDSKILTGYWGESRTSSGAVSAKAMRAGTFPRKTNSGTGSLPRGSTRCGHCLLPCQATGTPALHRAYHSGLRQFSALADTRLGSSSRRNFGTMRLLVPSPRLHSVGLLLARPPHCCSLAGWRPPTRQPNLLMSGSSRFGAFGHQCSFSLAKELLNCVEALQARALLE